MNYKRDKNEIYFCATNIKHVYMTRNQLDYFFYMKYVVVLIMTLEEKQIAFNFCKHVLCPD